MQQTENMPVRIDIGNIFLFSQTLYCYRAGSVPHAESKFFQNKIERALQIDIAGAGSKYCTIHNNTFNERRFHPFCSLLDLPFLLYQGRCQVHVCTQESTFTVQRPLWKYVHTILVSCIYTRVNAWNKQYSVQHPIIQPAAWTRHFRKRDIWSAQRRDGGGNPKRVVCSSINLLVIIELFYLLLNYFTVLINIWIGFIDFVDAHGVKKAVKDERGQAQASIHKRCVDDDPLRNNILHTHTLRWVQYVSVCEFVSRQSII